MDTAGGQETPGNHLPNELVGDRYRIMKVLATGSIATTYVAEDPEGTQVALKQLFLWRRRDKKLFHRIEREALTLSQLAYPGIPRFIDSFEADTPAGRCFYLIQALASGRTLQAWMDSGYRPTEAFVRGLADQLLGSLEYLHGFHPPVIHRDVKPANLVWRADGTLALVDFGAVRDMEGAPDDGSANVGALAFAAPEQLRGHFVPGTDLYGVGATCAYLLTKKKPAELSAQSGQPKLNLTNVSGAFQTWTERLLARDPAARFASATEARAELKGTKLVTVRATKPSLALKVLGATAAFLLSGGLAFAAIVFFSASPEPKTSPQPTKAPTGGKAALRGIEVSTGRMKWVKNFVGHWGAVFDLAVDATGTRLVTASTDGTAKVWDLETAATLRSLTGHKNKRVGAVFVTPDGKYAVTGSDLVRVFELETGSLVRELGGHQGEVTAVSASSDGTRIASTSLDGTARLWDFATGKEQAVFNAQAPCLSVSWSPDGDRAAVGCGSKVHILDAKTGQQKSVYAAHTATIDEVAYSTDGKTLVSASDDRTIHIWTEQSMNPLTTLKGHTDEVWGLSLSPDGRTLLSGSKDQTIRLWDVYAAKQLDVIPLEKVLKVRFLADGQHFVAGQSNGYTSLFTLGQAGWQPPKITSPVPHPPRVPPAGTTEDDALCIAAQQALDEAAAGSNYVAESRRLASAALAKNPKSAFARAMLARAEYRSGYRRGEEYDPKSLERADSLLDEALALDPNLVVVHVTRAYVYAFQKNLEKANQSAGRARQLDDKDPRVLLLSGFLAVKSKQWDEAFALSRSVVETTRDPYYLSVAYDALIDIYRRRQNWNAAEDVYRSLVNLDADDAWRKGNFAGYLNRRHKYDEAIDWAKQAIAQSSYPLARTTLAEALAGKAIQLLEAGGPTPEVEKLVDEAEKASARSADAHYARGRLHQAQGNTVRATVAFQTALAIEPDHTGAKAALAEK